MLSTDKIKKIENYAYKTSLYSTLVGTVFYSLVYLSSPICALRSSRINTQTQLEKLVAQERRKIDNSNNCIIYPILLPISIGGESRKLQDGVYEVRVGGDSANTIIVRHELYHILDGHFQALEGKSELDKSEFMRFLKYFLLYEPQARIYSITSLKL